MPIYNHAFDMGFSIETPFPAEEFDKIPPSQLRAAILRRLASIPDEELLEALGGPSDTYVVSGEDAANDPAPGPEREADAS